MTRLVYCDGCWLTHDGGALMDATSTPGSSAESATALSTKIAINRLAIVQPNTESVRRSLEMADGLTHGLVFVNLNDFDSKYGHRRDVRGYGEALERLDAMVPEIIARLRPGDGMLLTADHGCDPTTPSTDHSREYVPLLAYPPGKPQGNGLGLRSTLSDIGQTVAENFGVTISEGTSFLEAVAQF